MYYPEKEKIVSLDILKLYRGGGRGGEHIIQGLEEDNLPFSKSEISFRISENTGRMPMVFTL